MRRVLIVASIVLLGQSLTAAHQDRLEGRWVGTVEGPQGQQTATATFKKEADKYTGTITGLRPDSDAVLKDIKLDGDKLTAKTEVDTGQATVVVNYSFVVQGDSLKGKGEVEFAGQTYAFNFDLKRGGSAPPAAPGGQQQPRPPSVPQPQQKQSLSYFAGQWTFKWIGRESALGPAPREGTTTYTLSADGKTLEGRTDGKSDDAAFKETALIAFDESTKMLTVSERLGNGLQIQSKGDWHSPISIRFTVDPIKVKGQTLLLRRTISVVAAHSFAVTEELSENGGPFVRLGSAVYSKVMTNK